MGILPIRDIVGQASVLPDVGQDFAADLEATRPVTTHDALRRRHDGGTQAAKDPRNTRRTRVHAQPRLADALEAHQDRVAAAAARCIPQVNTQYLADAFAT